MDFNISVSEALAKHLERTKFVNGVGALKRSSKDPYLYGSRYRKASELTGMIHYHIRPLLKDVFLNTPIDQNDLEAVINQINDSVNIFHFKPIFKTLPTKFNILF